MKTIPIKKGDQIIHNGKFLMMVKDFKLNAVEVYAEKQTDTSMPDPKGEGKTDAPIPVDLKTVLSILEKEIDRLSISENKIFTDGVLEDDLSFLDDETEPRDAGINEHLEVSNKIMQTRKLLKKIKALQ